MPNDVTLRPLLSLRAPQQPSYLSGARTGQQVSFAKPYDEQTSPALRPPRARNPAGRDGSAPCSRIDAEDRMSGANQIKRFATLGNHLPRHCGIATFTTHLTDALIEQLPAAEFVVAVNDAGRHHAYPSRVRFEIGEGDLTSYRRAADFLNVNQVDVLSVQHEYGIFGGKAGAHLLELLRDLRMPVVTTLHTILSEPNTLISKQPNCAWFEATRGSSGRKRRTNAKVTSVTSHSHAAIRSTPTATVSTCTTARRIRASLSRKGASVEFLAGWTDTVRRKPVARRPEAHAR